MKPFLPILLLSASAFFACEKNTHQPKPPVFHTVQWRWTSYTLPGAGNGSFQPARDSTVILFLDGDSSFNIRVNGSLLSAGYYHTTPDSVQMNFSTPALVYPNSSLRLCTTCALTVSKDSLTLRPPLASQGNGSTFIFVKLLIGEQ